MTLPPSTATTPSKGEIWQGTTTGIGRTKTDAKREIAENMSPFGNGIEIQNQAKERTKIGAMAASFKTPRQTNGLAKGDHDGKD